MINIKIIFGIILFISGIKILSNELKQHYDFKIHDDTPVRLILSAILITTIIQSSSIVICLIMVLINSKRLSLKGAVYLLMGANIGTTSTALITSFSYTFTLIIIISSISFFMTKNAKIAISITLFLSSLTLIKGDIGNLTPLLNNIINQHSNIVIALFVMFITMLIQSSSLIITILQQLLLTTTISYEQMLFILFGLNIGTTSTAIMCSLAMNNDCKKLALFHLLFNIIASIITLIIYYLSPLNLSNLGKYTVFANHFTINLLGTLLFYFIFKFLPKRIEKKHFIN